MSSKLFICTILLFQGSLLFSQSTTNKIKLSFIKEVNADFVSIVDNLIDSEKKCEYYTDSLFFSISVMEYPERLGKIYLEIESCKDKSLIWHFKPLAFFKRNKHLFYVYNAIPKKLFLLMDNPIEFSYEKTERTDDVITNDDSFSHWIYLFYNNKFSLLSSFSWCE